VTRRNFPKSLWKRLWSCTTGYVVVVVVVVAAVAAAAVVVV
jgi:hypothetical protein